MNSLNLRIKFVFSAFVFSSLLGTIEAQVIDKIIAVVDSGLSYQAMLKRRLNDLKTQAESRGNEMEVNDELRQQVIERLILEQAQLEVAKRGGSKSTTPA